MLVPIAVLYLIYSAFAVELLKPHYDLQNATSLKYHFEAFIVKHQREYLDVERDERFKYFVDNLAKINDMNQNNPLAVFDVTKFSDWSPAEFESSSCLPKPAEGGEICDFGKTLCSKNQIAPDLGEVLDSVDWRQKNAVTPAQDQGKCGSCWAFGTTALVEGAHALKSKELLKLSEQQLVDCDKQDDGCKGGCPDLALTYLIQAGGQELESDYTYQAKQQPCRFEKAKAKVQVKNCQLYRHATEESIARLVANKGPLSIALDAGAFQHYHTGVISTCAHGQLNHAVAIVGYGEDNGVPLWIVKNSWGQDWGEKGFVRIKRGEKCLGIGDYTVAGETN